jgi:hypothetical protein
MRFEPDWSFLSRNTGFHLLPGAEPLTGYVTRSRLRRFDHAGRFCYIFAFAPLCQLSPP